MVTVLEMCANLHKLGKFEGVALEYSKRRCISSLLHSLGVAYVLSTPKLEEVENEIVEATRQRNK